MKIETVRLVLRPLVIDDHAAIQKYFPHWDIVKHLSATAIKWPYPADGAQKFLQNIALPAMQRGEDWYMAITRRDDAAGEVIGVVHLRRDTTSGNRGVWLAQDFQGKGYMQEAVAALNDYAFDVLGFDRLLIKNAQENEASRRLKQKSGAVLLETRAASHYLGGCPAQEVWELTAAQWQAAKIAKAQPKLCAPSVFSWQRKLADVFAVKAPRRPVFCPPQAYVGMRRYAPA